MVIPIIENVPVMIHKSPNEEKVLTIVVGKHLEG